MRKHARSAIAAAFLLAPAAVTVLALPQAAIAQTATPEVRSLEVNSNNGILPGSVLRFRMEASPRSEASVRIRGVPNPIALREVERGLYVGRYTISRNDRIEEGAPIRAIVRNGNRTATASYNVPEGLGAGSYAQGPQQQPAPQQLRVERFSAAPIDRLEPGAELHFMVEATPGAEGFIDLPGMRNNVPLRETRPGVYEGNYTLRRVDNVDPNGRVMANLRWGDRVVTAELQQPLVARGPAGLPIEITSHPNNGVIEGDVARVRGHTAPFARVEVRVQAAPPVVGQIGVAQQVFAQTIQADREGNFEFAFRSPFPVPGTRYDVSLVANKGDVTREARIVLFQRQG
jgi:hypothetical protein